MKFLILFAVGALFGSVQCDEECFRAVFRECVDEPVPLERMTLCDEIQKEINCIARFANKCNMTFIAEAEELKKNTNTLCYSEGLKEIYNENKACYLKSMNADECVGPIKDAMKDSKTSEDIMRANKKICSLFDSYSTCVDKDVLSNCGPIQWAVFRWIYNPHQSFSDSLCKELIVPADETDKRPDNFGVLNVYKSAEGLFH